jgi:hypothetical protein
MADDTVLIEALHRLEAVESGAPPVDALLRRARRRRAVRLSVTSATVAAAAVLAVLAIQLVPGATPASSPELAPVSLEVAARTTTQSTFHVAITSSGYRAGGGPSTVIGRLEGAMDPTRQRGYIRYVPTPRWPTWKYHEIRQIKDHCYVQFYRNGDWRTDPWRPRSGDPDIPPGCFPSASFGTGSSVVLDPVAVLERLKADGSATYVGRKGSGSSAVDVWRLGVDHPLGDERASDRGTVTVDVSTKRILTLTYRTVPEAKRPPDRSSMRNAYIVDGASYTFSGFGAPVTVEVPK